MFSLVVVMMFLMGMLFFGYWGLYEVLFWWFGDYVVIVFVLVGFVCFVSVLFFVMLLMKIFDDEL